MRGEDSGQGWVSSLFLPLFSPLHQSLSEMYTEAPFPVVQLATGLDVSPEAMRGLENTRGHKLRGHLVSYDIIYLVKAVSTC